MRIPKARILKYAAMGIIAAFIATFFLKKEKQQGHPRDYAEIAAEKIIRAAQNTTPSASMLTEIPYRAFIMNG